MTDHDERELEEAFRASLQRHAEEIDVSVPVAELAVAANRRRRQGLVVMAVAAVAVAAVAIGGAWIAGGSEDEDAPRLADRSSDPGEVVTEWRTEYWHGMQVDVPADWGWGTTPVSSGEMEYLCGGPGAMVLADGRRIVNADATKPWVGRPIRLSDACIGGDPLEKPAVPYVWLGADIAPGVVELPGAFIQETVEVEGTTLTVATRDEGVRRAIVESARASTTCAATLPEPPEVTSMLTEGIRKVREARVCAYRGGGDAFQLAYATMLGAKEAAATHEGVYAGQRSSSPAFCERSNEYVLITFTGDDPFGSEPVSQDVVIDPQCQEVQGAPGSVAPLSDEAMLPWSRNGLQVVLRSFIGTLG